MQNMFQLEMSKKISAKLPEKENRGEWRDLVNRREDKLQAVLEYSALSLLEPSQRYMTVNSLIKYILTCKRECTVGMVLAGMLNI